MAKVTNAEAYIENLPHWAKELTTLRDILLASDLEETIKWNMPTYTYQGKNLISMCGFKQHFCLWFHQGVFLEDTAQRLVNAQEGKTSGMRQMRFTHGKEIDKKLIVAYIAESIVNQKAGKVIQPSPAKKIPVPPELKSLIDANPKLDKAFAALTPAQRNLYNEYISSAKRANTKERRLDEIQQMILAGKTMADKYRRR